MHNIIIAVLLAAFVSVVATSYYYDYKIKKASTRLRTELPTAIEAAYTKGYKHGFKVGKDESLIDWYLKNPKT
jgi:hypothetical protein